MENFCEIGKFESKTLGDLKPVLYDEKVGEENPSKIIYYVARDIEQAENRRYDLTKINPEMMGTEFPKTSGHYHSNNAVELFEVIKGETIVIMQKTEETPDIIKEVYAIHAVVGEKIIILPDFGFTNINASQNISIISNWIDVNVKNEYDNVKNFHGLSYYTLNNNGEVIFEKNKNYKEVPEIIKLKPKQFPKELDNLDFISNPEKYLNILTINNLYEKI